MDRRNIVAMAQNVARGVGVVVILFALTASFTFAPYPGGTALDTSWQALLTYAHEQHLQYGKDMVFTYGPLSYLVAGQAAFTGMFWGPYVAGLLFDLALAVLFLLLLRPLHPVVRILAVMVLVFFGVIFDAQYLFFISAGAFLVIIRTREQKPWDGRACLVASLWALMVGVIALTKFSFLLLALVAVSCSAFVVLRRSGFRRSLAVALPFWVPLVLTYTIGDQSPANVLPFFRSALVTAGGYGEAMSMFPLLSFSILGLVVLCIHALVLAAVLLSWRPRGIEFCCVLVVYAATIFFAWKSAFTRADAGHMGALFSLTLCMVPLVWVFLRREGKWPRIVAVLLMGVAFVVSTGSIGLVEKEKGRPLTTGRTRDHLHRATLRILAPHHMLQELRWRYAHSQQVNDMPRARAMIGDDSVDVFGFEHGYAIINRFALRPRPVSQTYCAYSRELITMNRIAIESRPPEWILFKLQSIDNRLPTFDDSQSLAHILYNYEPALEELGFLVLKKRKQPIKVIPPGRLLLETTIGFGEGLDLSSCKGQVLWLEVEIEHTLLGRGLNLL